MGTGLISRVAEGRETDTGAKSTAPSGPSVFNTLADHSLSDVCCAVVSQTCVLVFMSNVTAVSFGSPPRTSMQLDQLYIHTHTHTHTARSRLYVHHCTPRWCVWVALCVCVCVCVCERERERCVRACVCVCVSCCCPPSCMGITGILICRVSAKIM